MKQLNITFLLAVLMSMVGAKALAYSAKVDGIYYNFSGTTATVAYYSSSSSNSTAYSGNVVIPESFTYNGTTYIVTSIGSSAFRYCSSLTSVTIPTSVTSIGSNAFANCTDLTSVTIPNSVTSIGSSTFANCSSLISVTIPNSVTSIGEQAFYNCSGLTSVTIPNSVMSIGRQAFHSCTGSLTINCIIPNASSSDYSPFAYSKFSKVSFGNDVTTIGDYAFYSCTGLTSVTIPSSVTSIGSYAFYGSSCLASVTIPSSVTSIGSKAFYGCTGSLTINCNIPNASSYGYSPFANSKFSEVSFGNDVTAIGDYAFYSCTGLTSVTIPSSVTSIGSNAFANCTDLTSVTIPNSVTSIGSKAFYGCTGSLTINCNIPNASSYGYSPFANSKFSEVSFGNDVTSIGNYAFYGSNSLISVSIPNSVTAIGGYAFSSCSNLESVTIGTGVLSIGSYVFSSHRPAKVIWLTNTPPNNYIDAAGTVNYVANDLYTSLSNKTVYPFLSSLFEVDGVKYVPVSPSERTCDAIDCLYSDEAENIHIGKTVTNKGITLTVNQVQPYTFYRNVYVKDADLGFSGNIGKYAFYGCSAMETITLGEEIPVIGSYVFSGCSSLQTVILPNAVEALGEYAFQNCTNLTSVKISSILKIIEPSTFSGCTSLPEMSIPSAVTDIKNSVFYNCSSLKTVIMEDRETVLNLGSNKKNSYDYGNPLFSDCPLDSVYIGGNINYSTSSNDGYSPFYRNTSLRAVMITDKETEISENEFYGCTNLKNVYIGDGVETIGNWAFSGCSSLDYFSFGSSLSSIGTEAFSDCTAITQIISHAETPPTCGSQALDDINKWTCTLQVPAGGMSAYSNADQWKEFFFIEEEDVSGNIYKLTYILDGEEYKVYEMQYGDVITPEPVVPDEGYVFSGWVGLPETMPAKDVTVTGTITIDVQKWIDEIRYGSGAVHPVHSGHDNALAGGIKNSRADLDCLLDRIKKLYEDGVTITEDDINKFNEGVNIFKRIGVISSVTFMGNKFTCGIGGKIRLDYEVIDNTSNYNFTWFHSAMKLLAESLKAEFNDWLSSLDPQKYLWAAPGYYRGLDWYGNFASFTITVTADEGYHIKSIQIDGVEQEKTTFSSDEAGGESFVVIFEKDDIVITENGITIKVKADNSVVLSDCSNVSGSFTVPETLEHENVVYQITTIGENAFKGNAELTELIIPNTIKVIENQSFEGCINLKQIVIGSGVTSIGSMAFANISTNASPMNRASAYALQVYCYAEQVPETALDAFSGTAITDAVLYVKDNLISSYKNTAPWSDFGTIKGLSEATGITDMNVNDNDNRYYTLDGQQLQGKPTQKGVYIHNGKKLVVN